MADAYVKPQLTEYEEWNDTWVHAIVSGGRTQEDVVRAINQRLNEELQRLPTADALQSNFLNFLWNADWSPRPDMLDSIWRGIFQVAAERGWTEPVRDALFYWAECYLQGGASDVGYPQEARSAEEGGDDDEVQHAFVTASLGSARLFALGFTYSGFAFTALMSGLGCSSSTEEQDPHDPSINSDTQRIASCAQLLCAGNRIRLYLDGGGDDHDTPGFAGRWLQAAPPEKRDDEWRPIGAVVWQKLLNGLVVEQAFASPRALKLMKITLEHLQAGRSDLTSEQGAALVWPRRFQISQ